MNSNLQNRHRALIIALVLGLLFITPTAQATFWKITEFGDDQTDNGNCTLREAIRAANTNLQVDQCRAGSSSQTDQILLLAGDYELDLVNGTDENQALDGDLDISEDLRIEGAGAGLTTVGGDRSTSTERVFEVLSNEVSLRDFTVRGGNAGDSLGGLLQVVGPNAESTTLELIGVELRDGSAFGGGALAMLRNANVRVDRSVIRNNEATNNGGGILNAGVDLTVVDSQIIDNDSGQSGAGIYSDANLTIWRSDVVGNLADGDGGGVFTVDICDIQYSLIERNEANDGAGIWANSENCLVAQSAIVGNIAGNRGGGVFNIGAAAIRRSTLTTNEAQVGGGVYADNVDTLLDHVTLAANRGGGGIHNAKPASTEGSLFASNVGGNCIGEPIASGPFNLEDADTCGLVDTPDAPNLIDTNPMLGTFADNGGPTPTFALLPGSPAIDVVSSDIQAGCPNASDQRGYPRGRPVQGVIPIYFCDIGAYEVVAPHSVNSMLDEPDADETDDLCRTEEGTCTLRAAVEQANRTPGYEEIELPSGTFVIQPDSASADLGTLRLSEALQITGAGMNQTIISGAEATSLFNVSQLELVGAAPLRGICKTCH